MGGEDTEEARLPLSCCWRGVVVFVFVRGGGGGGVEEAGFRGERERSWLILDAAAAPRNELRGLLVLITLWAGVCGLVFALVCALL
jgi:hypothetical protein